MRNLITKLLFAFLLPLFFVACDDEDNDASSSCSVVIDGQKCKIVPEFLGKPGKIFGSVDWDGNGRVFWWYGFEVVNSNDDMFIILIDVSEHTLKSGLQLTATNSYISIDAYDYDYHYLERLSEGNVRVSSHSAKKSTLRFDNAVFNKGAHSIRINGSVVFENAD